MSIDEMVGRLAPVSCHIDRDPAARPYRPGHRLEVHWQGALAGAAANLDTRSPCGALDAFLDEVIAGWKATVADSRARSDAPKRWRAVCVMR